MTDAVALCVGGSNSWLVEYEAAKALCSANGKGWQTFVCNDTITVFPDYIDHGVTLHPDKMMGWLHQRLKNQLPAVARTWAHRRYGNFTDWSSEMGYSSGGHCAKIARELGHTHIILCGIPMTVEGQHFVRHSPWTASHGFRRGWGRLHLLCRNNIRSMSGWTREIFGSPDPTWLQADFPKEIPHFPKDHGRRA